MTNAELTREIAFRTYCTMIGVRPTVTKARKFCYLKTAWVEQAMLAIKVSTGAAYKNIRITTHPILKIRLWLMRWYLKAVCDVQEALTRNHTLLRADQ